MKVTIRDVARHAGVSIKTVSRVVNDEDFVRDETRAKVVQAIQELGYVVNVSAQRLASGRANTIGLIYHNASWHYVTHVLHGTLETGHQAGYSIILHPFDVSHPDKLQDTLQLVTQRSVDGFVFTPPADNSASLLNKLQSLQVPFVRLTPTDQQCPCPYVTTTDRQGAYDMVCYLASLGHRRIGFIVGPLNQKAGHERFAGYKEALTVCGLQFDPAYVIQGDDHFASGQLCASALLDRTPPPTAIFTNNDEMAWGVLAAAHRRGVPVPAGLSVVGFDDIPVSRQVWPPLTTVRQPIRKMAELATGILVRMLQGETLDSQRYEVPTELMIRDSTGPAPVNT